MPVVKSVSETLTHINASDSAVLLKVVPVSVHGPNGVFSSTALLDDSSSVSLMNSELARRAGLCGRASTLRVGGAFAGNELVYKSNMVNVTPAVLDNKVHNIR